MKRHHLRTLQALYAHPLQHGVRVAKVEALFRSLGATVTELGDRRLRLQMPAGQETWIHTSCGLRQPDLDAEAVMRIRHLLQAAGVTLDHPETDGPSPRGDQSRRLILHLGHRHTDVFRLEGEEVEHAILKPHGLWGTDQNLSHRHDRDQAGQRAPVDHDYLARLAAAIADADVVLLLGHGRGANDMRQLLLHDLESHHRELVDRIVGIETLDDGGLSDDQLLALAREYFGNLPHRRPVIAAGQAVT